MKLSELEGTYFNAAEATFYTDIEGTVPVTEEGQLIASARMPDSRLIMVQQSVAQRPKAVLAKAGYFVPEFSMEV
jgi:hypothetical protein